MGIEPTSEVWENCCLRFQIEDEAIPLERERPTREESAFLFVWSRLWTNFGPKPLLFVALNQHQIAQGQLNQRGLW